MSVVDVAVAPSTVASVANDNNAVATTVPTANTPVAVPARTDSKIQRAAALSAVQTVLAIGDGACAPLLRRFFESAGLSVHYSVLFGDIALTIASDSFFGDPAFNYQFAKGDWDESLDEFVKRITK
jgi:hypothetical protein